jgi:prophage regulatory protein
MPDTTKLTRVLRMKDLPPKIGLQPSTIYGLIAKGDFPTPFKFITGGRAAGWLEQTVDDWLSDRENKSL